MFNVFLKKTPYLLTGTARSLPGLKFHFFTQKVLENQLTSFASVRVLNSNPGSEYAIVCALKTILHTLIRNKIHTNHSSENPRITTVYTYIVLVYTNLF